MSNITLRLPFWALLCLSIVACSTKPPPPVSYDVQPLWQQRLSELEALESWELAGRVAIREGGQSWNAKLRWSQSGDLYDILITAPFGQGAARIYGEPGRAVIEVPNQSPLVASKAEALLYEHLGWTVPVESLKYWLEGRPDPGAKVVMRWDEFGRVVHLEQAGWEVEYRRYIEVGALALPRKLELINSSLRVKLIIDNWQLDS